MATIESDPSVCLFAAADIEGCPRCKNDNGDHPNTPHWFVEGEDADIPKAFLCDSHATWWAKTHPLEPATSLTSVRDD